MNMQIIVCPECREEFERDMDNPKVKKACEEMGAMADLCTKCLRKMLRSGEV